MIKKDIVIIGAGAVGLLLNSAIRQKGFSTLVLEQSLLNTLDTRFTGISHKSKLFLDKVGVWDKIVHESSEILDVHVSYKSVISCFNSSLLNKLKIPLGYVVPNFIIKRELLELNKDDLLRPAECVSVKRRNSGVIISLSNGVKISANLLIIAGGKNTHLKQSLGISSYSYDYKQKAILFTAKREVTNAGVANEHFYNNGILASLPLRDPFHSSCIWIENNNCADFLLKMNEYDFIKKLNNVFDVKVSDLLSSRSCYPIKLSFACKYHKGPVLLMGDALHSIHPVSAQGLNLSIKDIQSLVNSLYLGPGSNILSSKFMNDRILGNVAMISATDFMAKFLTSESLFANVVNRVGFNLISKSNLLRSKILSYVSGLEV